MPLTGPRPNPNPSSVIQRQPADPSQHSIPSFSSLEGRGPAFPPDTGSHLAYPHQSSPESGTTQLEPFVSDFRQDGLSGAQGIMRDYRATTSPAIGRDGEGDVGLLAPRPNSQYDNRPSSGDYGDGYRDQEYGRPHSETYYDNPYEVQPERNASPSLGPWDSASQRSLPYHPHPLPGATHVPLSATSGTSGGSKRGYNHVDKKPSHGGLSYIDEDGEYYHSDNARPASTHLARGRDGMELGNIEEQEQEPYKVKFADYQESPYPYPPSQKSSSYTYNNQQPNHLYTALLFPTGLDRLLALFGVKTGAYPIEQAIERKKRGLGGQRWPVAAWGLAVAMTAIMAYELVANYQAMGTPIAIHPSFNYMIGPSSEVLINIGARFPPCMKYVAALPPTFELACLNDTSSSPTTACTIEEICGHGGFPSGTPDQSWRFVYPIFLHVGLIHLALNMVAQVTAGAQVEREMGTFPFLLVYMAGGIYGFILGGNFTRTGIPSVGASGSLFATNACVLIDLILHWKYEERPKLKAFLLAVEFLIGFGLGYIPNAVDGLAHLGGWAMGLLMGIILYPSISETKRHRYILWGVRVVALVLVVLAFVMTIKNFYTDDPNAACEWCRYLSCIPTSSNDRCTGTGITTTNTTSTKRSWDLL